MLNELSLADIKVLISLRVNLVYKGPKKVKVFSIQDPSPTSKKSNLLFTGVMVNFIYQLDWAKECRYLVKHYSGFVLEGLSG